MREAHIQLDEEHGRAPQIARVPDDRVAHQADAPPVVGQVHHEPQLAQRLRGACRHHQPLGLQQREDLFDDVVAPEDHLQVAERGHDAQFPGVLLVGTSRGVTAAETAVAAEGEGAQRAGSVHAGVAEDEGCEAVVRDAVEGAGAGVEGQESGEREVGCEVEGDVRVGEDGAEDVERGPWRCTHGRNQSCAMLNGTG